ncbi:hypothetical protein SLS56_005788 [Neofusicoccum ribis]|uniref:TauD/TfdA-like domain-containing protein n=1 Tax=Neofusicoccum ribis TaxID=45134 RepID=A0ABR3SSG2_9PEZI
MSAISKCFRTGNKAASPAKYFLVKTASPSISRTSFNPFQSRNITTEPPQRVPPALESINARPIPEIPPPPDYQYLRNLVKSIPIVLDKPAPRLTEEKYFQLPLGTRFKAPTRELGLDMNASFAHAIREHGLAVIELGFDDPKSHFMLELVEAMGCTPDTHSSTQGALWDVTYKPSGVFSAATGGTAHSRSHGVGEFAWHTDGSFEETPQRFFGLHVIHPDRHGGGIFRVLPADDLVAALSPSSVEALLNTEFDIQVPAEFYKGRASNKGKLLDVEPGTGRYLLRFRRDILPDPPSENPSACEAVRELNALLETPEKVGWRFPGDVFKDNVVLLMDNARFLHSRTEIKDKRRLLRRVRFHGTPQV